MKLGDRMKNYEKQTRIYIPKEQYIIIRVDGHKFSKFTKGFEVPFDDVFSNAMIETTKFLMKRFNAVTGYKQSDEITLVIPPSFDKRGNNQIFGGRVDKIASLAAAFATQKFNKELFRSGKYPDKVFKASFDGRVFGVDSEEEAFNTVLWRIRDAEKNSRSIFASTFCSHKDLLNKTGEEKIKFCLKNTGKNWNDLEDGYKYGFLVKKELFKKEVIFERNGKEERVEAERSRFVVFSKKLHYSEDNVKMIVSKYK